MKQKPIILLILLLSIIACENKNHYEPEGLRKLRDTEIIDRAISGNSNLDIEKIVYKDSLGKNIPREDLSKLDQDKFHGDYYVNANNEVVEVVIRRATEEDKVLRKKILEAFEEGEPITIIDIDCSEIREILEAVHESDQENRKGGGVQDLNIDKGNQQKVVSIIEKCGFPTAEKYGHKSVEAVFLVIQHAAKSLREKYYPHIKESADKGDLSWSIVALMEDRMLMDKGEKQKYGSQVQKKNGSDKWVLYPIEDPQNVNVRRAEVGLGPIEEYLKHFDIDYQTEE